MYEIEPSAPDRIVKKPSQKGPNTETGSNRGAYWRYGAVVAVVAAFFVGGWFVGRSISGPIDCWGIMTGAR